MPFFRSTKDIFKTPSEDEVFDENWFDSDFLQLPTTYEWDYKRELQIEDIDIWEQIYFESGGTGLYAAWRPYAEFYLVTKDLYWSNSPIIETFYGKKSSQKAYDKAIELGMPIVLNKIWVDKEKMWLY